VQYNKKHINYFLVITLFVLSQDLYGTNYLKNVSFQGKENGLIIEFVFEDQSPLIQSTHGSLRLNGSTLLFIMF